MSEVQPHTQDYCALVLAGGRGRRMQGADKGLVSYQGRPLITYIVERLAVQAAQLIVVCNRNHAAYQQLLPAATVISDLRADFPGPLAGLEAALTHCQQKFLLCVPCDTPNLPENLGPHLRKALLEENADAAVVFDGERQQHLCLMLRADRALAPLQRYLDAGERRVAGFLAQLTTVSVDFSAQKAAFRNINDAATLALEQKRRD